jgi:hypothetical protein
VPTKEARSEQRPRSSPTPQQNENENEDENENAGLIGCVFCHRGVALFFARNVQLMALSHNVTPESVGAVDLLNVTPESVDVVE